MNVKILGIGHALPDSVVSNDELSKTLDTNNDWIVSRTGIKQRYVAQHDVHTSDLATEALDHALQDSGIAVDELSGIIVATTTPDLLMPSTATIVQKKIGMTHGFAFDIQAACAGFIYALDLAYSLIHAGRATKIAVIGAETMSRIVNWQDRKTCILFGDGAGAVVLSKSTDDDVSAVLSIDINSDGKFLDILKVPGGISTGALHSKLEMDGQEVYKFAIDSMVNSLQKIIKAQNITAADIDWVIAHQANYRIISSVATRLNIPMTKVAITVDQHANTSAASIPLAFSYYKSQKKIKRGDLLAFTAVGAGMTWGSALVRY